MIEIAIATALVFFGIIGYFLKGVHANVRKNTEAVGENKGRIEQLNIQVENERKLREAHFEALNKINKQAMETIAAKIEEIRHDIKTIQSQMFDK